jgi:hypothetical protein
MKTGSLEGFVDRTWQVVHDSGELAAATQSYIIDNLEGETDGKYVLYSRIVNAFVGSGDVIFSLNPQEATTNLGEQAVWGSNTTVGASRNGNTGGIRVGVTDSAAGRISLSETKIQVKTGMIRPSISKVAQDINGTTVRDIVLYGSSWNETSTPISKLAIFCNKTTAIGIGSRFILLKEVRIASGLRTGELDIRGTLKGAWQEVYRGEVVTTATLPHHIQGAKTSITVSGLLGNTKDQILRVRVRAVNGYNGAVNAWIKPNNCGAGACGYQSVAGNDTTPSAYRSTSEAGFFCGGFGALNQIMHSETIIYAKSGFVRTAIQEVLHANGTVVYLFGSSFNDTSNEITSLVISGDQIGTFGIGTEIVIERLNL